MTKIFAAMVIGPQETDSFWNNVVLTLAATLVITFVALLASR